MPTSATQLALSRAKKKKKRKKERRKKKELKREIIHRIVLNGHAVCRTVPMSILYTVLLQVDISFTVSFQLGILPMENR